MIEFDDIDGIGMRRMMGLTIAWNIVFAVLVGACAPEPQATPEPVNPMRMPTPTHTLSATALPIAAIPTVESDTMAETRPGDADCAGAVDVSAADYVLGATLDWMAHTLRVEQQVLFRNDTGRSLDEIIFNVEPSHDPGGFELRHVSVDNVAVRDSDLTAATLTLPLDEPLPAGCVAEIALDYDLTLPEIANGYRKGHLGYRGYSDRQVNLGMWFPMVAAFDPSRGWLSPPFHSVGEHYVLRTGDFDVTLSVQNAPESVRMAAPGTVMQIDGRTWRVELDDAREVALSLSDAFNTLTTTTGSGVEVVLYYFYDTPSDSLDAPRHALYVAADALALFETLYGAYPYERLVVAAGDFPDGMEFSGLVFVSEAWFQAWTGEAADWLTLITAHEIAHQWWYNIVGNDQGRHPYLDEALASYSELLFFEHYYAEEVKWWWDFRVNGYVPAGYVDAPVYEFASARAYINAIYLRGALLMQSVRDALGDDAFFAWLQSYVDHMTGQVASPRDLWGLLSAEHYASTAGARQVFFSQADVLLTKDDIP